MNLEFIAKNEADLDQIATTLWSKLTSKTVCFTGELGAGKTSLIKAMIRFKNKDEQVSSPSFSIINEYELDSGTLIHMDLYRLTKIEEAIDIGIEEYFDNNNWTFIEWPQIIQTILPSDYQQIHIEILESWERKIILI